MSNTTTYPANYYDEAWLLTKSKGIANDDGDITFGYFTIMHYSRDGSEEFGVLYYKDTRIIRAIDGNEPTEPAGC